jgi:flagellar hook-associated protein 3 FlgL
MTMSTINRVTQRMIANRSLAGLQSNISNVSRLQEKLSTGRQLNRPSDSPSGTSAALQLRGEIRRNTQWSANADDGLAWLGQLDSTLTGMSASLVHARELTLQGMNTGAMGPEARNALATELDQLRAQLVSDANQTYLGRPVFGGTTGGGAAYVDAPGGAGATFVGNTQQVMRTVGANSSVRVDLSGPETFGAVADGPDLFATLATISDHLRNDPSKLTADLGTLVTQTTHLQDKLGDIGARENRIEKSKQAADDRGLSLTNSLSDIESIDLPETIMQLEMANVSYQAALGATAKVIQPSLMDFLR